MSGVKTSSDARSSGPWDNLPRGWDKSSLESYWKTMTGEVKHKVTKCIKDMEGKIDDPGAFCASLADKVEGKEWRSRRSFVASDVAREIVLIARELSEESPKENSRVSAISDRVAKSLVSEFELKTRRCR